MKVIEINDLLYAYGNQKPLFDRLHLSLEPGNIYGLLGKNGAGKSSLMKIIAGLLFPRSETIDVMGHRPSQRHPSFLQEVFLLSEEFDLPNMSIQQYVQFYSCFYPRFSTGLFQAYMDEFKLVTATKIQSLSYGQKKKFLLSFGLATDCKLLLLDEPTNGLDIPSKSQFRKLVANALTEERTFVISTHQVRDMEGLIDPVIILDEGEVVFNESAETVATKLKVSRRNSIEDETSLIYSEGGFGNYTIVSVNDDHSETNMPLEMLFNTVIHSKEQIHELFKANE